MACQVAAKEAAVAIALKDCLALLTADSVIIPDSLRVFAKHIGKRSLPGRVTTAGLSFPLLFAADIHAVMIDENVQ
jgi:hypothetical protein